MKYKKLGNSGLLVSELCLGTMTFGGKGYWEAIGRLGQAEAADLVRIAVDAGVNFIDTANVYSEGEAERLTGQAIKDLGLKRESLVLATKVRGKMDDGPNGSGLSRVHILREAKASLARLQTDYIDLYQIHGFDPATPIEETLEALDSLVRGGLVRYIGVSNHAAWQVMKALGRSEALGLARFQSLQAYYTIAGRDLERELVPLLADQRLGLLVWSPLAGGLLSGKFRKGAAAPQGARRASFDFPPVNMDRLYAVLGVIDAIAAARGISAARVALAWLLAKNHVTSVIIGARKPEQLQDDLASVSVGLTAEELRKLDEISELPPEYPGWMLTRMAQDRQGYIPRPG